MSFTHSVHSESDKVRIWSREAVHLFLEPLLWAWRTAQRLIGLLSVEIAPRRPWELMQSHGYTLRDLRSVDPRFAATVIELILSESRDRSELMKSASSLVFILDQKLSNAETECLEALYEKAQLPKSPMEHEVLQHLFRIGFVEKVGATRKTLRRDQVKLSEAGAIYLAMLQQERRKSTSPAKSY